MAPTVDRSSILSLLSLSRCCPLSHKSSLMGGRKRLILCFHIQRCASYRSLYFVKYFHNFPSTGGPVLKLPMPEQESQVWKQNITKYPCMIGCATLYARDVSVCMYVSVRYTICMKMLKFINFKSCFWCSLNSNLEGRRR